MAKFSDLKEGDEVIVLDGSWSVRLDKYEPRSSLTGYQKRKCVVIRKIDSAAHSGWSYCIKPIVGMPMHNIHIRDSITGEIFLHSAYMVKKVEPPKCVCCGKVL